MNRQTAAVRSGDRSVFGESLETLDRSTIDGLVKIQRDYWTSRPAGDLRTPDSPRGCFLAAFAEMAISSSVENGCATSRYGQCGTFSKPIACIHAELDCHVSCSTPFVNNARCSTVRRIQAAWRDQVRVPVPDKDAS